MRGLVVTEAGSCSWQDIAEPEVGPYDALVSIEACGVCSSTDRKLLDCRLGWQPKPPFVLGHEAVGRVTAVGDKVRNFALNDRVTRPVAWWPGTGPMGVGIGGFAERGIVRDAHAMHADGDTSLDQDYLAQRQVVIPGELEPGTAALGITLAETASVMRHLGPLRGAQVAVADTGCVGLSFMRWAKLAGTRVFGLGRRSERLDAGRHNGADLAIDTRDPDWSEQLAAASDGLDVVIDTTCDIGVCAGLSAARKPDGRACAYGAPPDGHHYPPEWTTAVVEEHFAWPWIADLLVRGWIDPADFITHRYEREASVDVFDSIAKGEVIKAVVDLV
ncbi:MAG: zinc-binding dehydrogenase [Planctomycetota bacterium]|jgi:threonine dehydrogenase-like Zn-dependent dehydrogenase|nr:zinc-binding dehydrogenase [Planctomycetota bacterium]